MAQSRLEKVTNIFKRVESLLKGKAIGEEYLPLWYEVYAKFPPKYEPTFARPVEDIPIRKIFYPEDLPRARFQSEYVEGCHFKLQSTATYPSKTQDFLAIYQNKAKEGVPNDELYAKAVEEFRTKFGLTKKKTDEEIKKEIAAKKEAFKQRQSAANVDKVV